MTQRRECLAKEGWTIKDPNGVVYNAKEILVDLATSDEMVIRVRPKPELSAPTLERETDRVGAQWMLRVPEGYAMKKSVRDWRERETRTGVCFEVVEDE